MRCDQIGNTITFFTREFVVGNNTDQYMLNERKLSNKELDKRAEAIQGLLSNKRTLVKKYGKDEE